MPPDQVRFPPAAAVVLAAGQAVRMGQPKPLLPFRGEPLVRRAARTAIEAGYTPVIVIVGDDPAALGAALEGLDVTVIRNHRAAQGIGTSIAAGVSAVAPAIEHLLLMLCDQPLVSPAHLARLRRTANESDCAIVASSYAGTVGVPALFTRGVLPRLAQLGGDQGCKGVIRDLFDRTLLVSCPEGLHDIDTPEDYAHLTTGFEGR